MKKLLITLFTAANIYSYAQNEIIWETNFGGRGNNFFYSVTPVSDGIVAVGYADKWTFGYDDWTGITGKGNDDAIIVKYDNNGNVIWKKNFGGTGNDYFYDATTVPDGIVAVGNSIIYSVGTGDWEGVTGNGRENATIVKFNNDGDVVWKKNFGSMDFDYFYSVTTVPEGIIAVGYFSAFKDKRDCATNEGIMDGIIIKCNNDGDVIWKKNFNDESNPYYAPPFFMFRSVITVPDGVIATGNIRIPTDDIWSNEIYLGIILLKYDFNGEIVWQKKFNEGIYDCNQYTQFNSLTAVSDGFIAAGYATQSFFGAGDLENLTSYWDVDGIIVKFDFEGNVVWKNNNSEGYSFYSVTKVFDGVIVAGVRSGTPSFCDFDWTGYGVTSPCQSFITKVDNDGNTVWKSNDVNLDLYCSVTSLSENVVAVVGFSDYWHSQPTGTMAIIKTYDTSLLFVVPVTDIINIPDTVTTCGLFTLKGTVSPYNATYQHIIWSIVDAGTTGASIINDYMFYIFTAPNEGTAKIKAVIKNGKAIGDDFIKICDIEVKPYIKVVDNKSLQFVIYPNPTSGKLQVTSYETTFGASQLQVEKIEIFDVLGRIVYSSTCPPVHSSTIIIDISHLQSGIYYLKINNETFKIIKN